MPSTWAISSGVAAPQRVDRAEAVGQQLRGHRADVRDAERRTAAGRTAAPWTPRSTSITFVADRSWKPSSAQQVVDGQPVEVGRLGDEPGLHQPQHELLAHAVDVHRAARDEVRQSRCSPRPGRPRFGQRCLTSPSALHHRRAAGRAAVGHRPRAGRACRAARASAARPPAGSRRPARWTITRVALADVLAADVLLVVQRRERHGHAADVHRLEHGERVQRPGAADVDADVASVVSAVVGANL